MAFEQLADPEFMAAAAERARTSRVEQGLPPTVTDPVIIAKTAAIFAQAARSAAEVADNERKAAGSGRRRRIAS